MENTYFLSLKEKYSSPQEAYRAYTLQKTLWRVGTVSPNATQDVKDSFVLQEKLNTYLEKSVTNENVKFSEEFNIKLSDMMSFINDNITKFEFLGIDRQQVRNLATDRHIMQVHKASHNIDSWTQLEDLMTQEKYIQKPETKQEIISVMEKTIKNCGLTSMIGSAAITTVNLISQVEDNFNQLATVVGCNKSQIGGNIFSVALSTEPDNGCAGYSNQYFKDNQQKLYVDALILNDAFAHEWLHCIDNIWAKKIKSSASHASETSSTVIEDLLKKGQAPNIEALNEIKHDIETRTRNFCKNIVQRYEDLGKIVNKEGLLEFIDGECSKVMSNTWNKTEFKTNLQPYKHPEISEGFQCYLSTELDLLNELVNGKALNHSIFYSYALKMDKNLVEVIGEDWGTYSVEKCEQFARLFESYCDITLKDKGVQNTISDISRSFYIPSSEEAKGLLKEWEPVIKEIRNIINDLSPLQNNIQNTEFKLKSWDKTRTLIEKIRGTSEIHENSLSPIKLKN